MAAGAILKFILQVGAIAVATMLIYSTFAYAYNIVDEIFNLTDADIPQGWREAMGHLDTLVTLAPFIVAVALIIKLAIDTYRKTKEGEVYYGYR